MTHRQTGIPSEWLIVDRRVEGAFWNTVRKLPRGSGILVLQHDLAASERSKLLVRLNRFAERRRLTIVDERRGWAARVHNMRELRQALSIGTALLLLSPIYPTRSHPDWKPLPRMRAATLARLANRRAVALGGMDRRRFITAQKLGFVGWAGIDAWIKT
jgi:thiamine-phosphate pyrophosphorylase